MQFCRKYASTSLLQKEIHNTLATQRTLAIKITHCLTRIHSIHRVGQNPNIYGVYTVFLAGKSSNILSYTVYIYGPGQPSVCATHMKAREHRLWGRQGHSCLAQCQPVLVAFRAVKVLCLSWCYQCQCLLCTHQQCITAASQINSIALLSVFAMHTPTVYHCYQCPLCTHQQCIIAISVRYAHANKIGRAHV